MTFQSEEGKLDWMYKGATSLVDREEYLLGRKIDKTLEILNEEEKHNDLGIVQPKNHVEHECIPPSIRDYNKIQIGEQQVDLATKLQEDPLVAIRKREEETRKQFLQNPIQLKKLQSTLDEQLKRRKRKSKKLKSIDIDALFAEKLQHLRNGPLDIGILGTNEDALKEKKLDKILLKKMRKYKTLLSEQDIKEVLSNKKKDKEYISGKDSDNDESHFKGRKASRNIKREPTGSQDSSYKRPHYQRKEQYSTNNRTTGLTEEEKEKRRKEMMDNAVWRDSERSNNVRRYREEDAREDGKPRRDYNPEFIHKELQKSANTGSMEKRIKSNINNIQRSKGDMNRHFSKRM